MTMIFPGSQSAFEALGWLIATHGMSCCRALLKWYKESLPDKHGSEGLHKMEEEPERSGSVLRMHRRSIRVHGGKEALPPRRFKIGCFCVLARNVAWLTPKTMARTRRSRSERRRVADRSRRAARRTRRRTTGTALIIPPRQVRSTREGTFHERKTRARSESSSSPESSCESVHEKEGQEGH